MFKKRYKINFLDEKWVPIKVSVKFDFIPRTHELVFINSKYYRVVNVIHNLETCVTQTVGVYIIIELYSDDLKLLNKKEG